MSLKPGIGYNWLLKYLDDVYSHDHVIIRGREMKPPKYYDKVFFNLAVNSNFDIDYDQIIDNRIENSKKYACDNTPDRLLVKEQCVISRLNQYKRGKNL